VRKGLTSRAYLCDKPNENSEKRFALPLAARSNNEHKKGPHELRDSVEGERDVEVELQGSTDSTNPLGCGQWHQLLHAARGGHRESLGELLGQCRQYLLLVANQELGDQLQAKAGASDLVQETFVEACQNFTQFQGNADQLMAWLREILLHRLAKLHRRYRRTEKRNVARERSEEATDHAWQQLFDSDATSPSEHAVRAEDRELLEAALERLSEVHRQVLALRHQENLTFAEIGERMGRSDNAARMLWWRAFERLAGELERK
jgi:RNA polymerase sigma-70 factor (ECF subfamily)